MQDQAQIKEQMNKLNKNQRATMRKIWHNRTIDTLHAETRIYDKLISIRVRSNKGFWLCVELGPRGGIKANSNSTL